MIYLKLILIVVIICGCGHHDPTIQKDIEDEKRRMDSINKGNNYDTLMKYSYLLKMKNSINKASATGFFYKNNEKLYLITCYHVAFAVNLLTGKNITDPWDTVFIRIIRKDGSIGSVTIPMANHNKTRRMLKFSEGYFDAVVIPIDYTKENDNIYSINSLLENYSQYSRNPVDIFSFGFGKVDCDSFMTNVPPYLFAAYKGQDNLISPVMDKVEHTEVYLLNPDTHDGMSGSPVFCYYNNTNTVAFGGMIFMTDSLSKETMILRVESIKEILHNAGIYQ